jgi:hypothetical protein
VKDAYLITIDIDWAPDFMIAWVGDLLRRSGVKATWFVTHDSPGVLRLMAYQPRFAFGLHPNLLDGSTQGSNERDVFSFLRRILPSARTMRTHGLVQSTHLLELAGNEYGIEADVSVYMPEVSGITPFEQELRHNGRKMLRIPYFFEDSIAIGVPEKSIEFSDSCYHVPGLKIFNFHPVHIYLNSDTEERYNALKQLGPLPSLSERQCSRFVDGGVSGVRKFFEELVSHISQNQRKSYTIDDVVKLWRPEPCASPS